MRVCAHFAALCLLAIVPRSVSIAQQAPVKKDAATVLAQAREALGGEKRLSSVKNFVATGRTRQVRGENLVPIEFEIACELPDKYVRKDEIPAQESGPTSLGFNGDELIQLPVPTMPTPPAGAPAGGRAAGPPGSSTPPPGPPKPPAEGAAQRGEGAGRTGGPAAPGVNPRVAMVKQDFVRMTLGMFAASFSSYPLTFTYFGQAEAPQGTADVLDVKGPASFSARLFINSQTHLPVMLSWSAPAGRGRGPAPGGPPPAGAAPAGPPPAGPPPAGAPAAGPSRGASPAAPPPGAAPGGPPAAAAPVEYRLYFGEYREVDGMQWPFRLRRATGSETTEETTFDRFRINTKIDPKKFEVRK